METQPDTSSLIKKNLSLVVILAVTTVATLIGIRFFLNAQAPKIPEGYSALSYITALESGDRNGDGFINGLDASIVLNRYGTSRLIADPKFGTKYNSLERSFQIANFNTNISAKKISLLKNPTIAKQYSEDIIVANELTVPIPNYLKDDASYNKTLPYPPSVPGSKLILPAGPSGNAQNLISSSTNVRSVLGETAESPDTRAGGKSTGSKGADSGRSIIPSILGTVSPYTGSAGFDYPISLPAGPGGIAPAVSLSYSSGNVDDALPYDDKFISDFTDSGQPINSYYYQSEKSYSPFFAGYGFSLSGGGSIVRDTRQEKEVYVLEGDVHHRFILNLPSGLSVELKYNKLTGRWTSIPEGFVKVDHVAPDPEGRPMPGSDFRIVDGTEWIVTASDGSKYYFGEQKLSDKINNVGAIHGVENITTPSSNATNCEPGPCVETPYDALHHAITNSPITNNTIEDNRGIYNEFDIADLCRGLSTNKPCDDTRDGGGKKISGRLHAGKPALLVTKWLLRRMETSDGKAIIFQYDNYQKFYGQLYKKDWDTGLAFATVDSYLRTISWNDDKHRVVINREDRTEPDKGGNQFLATQRLSNIEVQTKLPDNTYHLVRRYQLNYSNDNSAIVSDGGANPWNASLLTSIQECGTNCDSSNPTKTPPVSLKYKQYGFENGPSGSTLYLSQINNGYGGETQYTYEPFTYSMLNGSGDPATGAKRVRVIEKRVTDQTSSPNRSFKETYNYPKYNDGKETYIGFADRIRGDNVSGREFLGHAQVDIKTYDFDSNKVLAHSKTKFFQFNGTWGKKSNCQNHQCHEEDVDGWTCFEPNLSRGQSKVSIVYNQLATGGEVEASKTETHNNYRILDWDASGRGVIKEDNLGVESKTCTGIGMTQPYFIFPKETISTATEPVSGEFAKTGVMSNLQVTPVNTRKVKSENLSFDLFGNLLKGVSFGPVDENNEDIDSSDNRYSYSYYLAGNPNWLNNLPYLSYASTSSTCASDNKECQFGRSEIWYDQFYGDFTSVDTATQTPSLGLVSQTKNFIETDGNHDRTHDDPIVTYQGNDYLRLSDDGRDHDANGDNDTADLRRGGVTRVYGPKPNLKTIDKPSDQIMLLSKTEYDPYYKSLVINTENALGFKSQAQDYDYLLQVPRKSLSQISKNPDKFSVGRVEFDALGRPLATFGTDPTDTSKTLPFPQTISTYFDPSTDSTNSQQAGSGQDPSTEGYLGLATRQMSLMSQTKDGAVHYLTSDAIYDGLGQVKQTQILSKKVDGVEKRLVSDAVYNGAGQELEKFEPQVADAVTLPSVDANNYNQVIRQNPPQLVSIERKVLTRSVFDGLNRPIESTIFDVDNNTSLTSKSFYYINAQKAINPKGVATVATSDSLGRPVEALVIDPVSDQHTLTSNEYGQPMIDKPTQTTYKSIKQLEGGNSAVTTVVYDKSGRVVSSHEPSLGDTSFRYDVNGNIISSKRGARQDNDQEYDVLGRLIKTTYQTSSSQEELYKDMKIQDSDVVYTYDSAPYALGKLVSVKYHTGRDEFSYDSAGRQEIVKKTIRDKSYETKTHYNILSQVTQVDYPDNQKYQMEFDNEGITQKTYLNGEQLAASTIFDKFGHAKESQFVLGANTYVSQTPYDTMGRLTELSLRKLNNVHAVTAIFYQKLNYDASSQLTPLTEITYKDGQENKTDFTYTYDAFARLTKAQSSKFNTSYSYDPFGRIQTKNEKENLTLAYDSRFPFFAPKAMSQPRVDDIPLPTPIIDEKPIIEPTRSPNTTLTPTPTRRLTASPTPSTTLRTSPTPTRTSPTPTIPQPTSTPIGCFFEPVVAIKERLADGSLRTLTTDEAKEYFTVNDKRKAKYDTDSTKKEFWTPFVDGLYKACPAGGCNLDGRELCCVDETNVLPFAYRVGEKNSNGEVQPKVDKANVEIKYFGTGSSKWAIVDKYCTNKDGATGCPADTSDRGGLRDVDYSLTVVPHLEIGCSKQYEYGWIVVKNNAFGNLLRSIFPARRGLAEDSANTNATGGNISSFSYNTKGAMLQDDKQCYSYNRLNQLTTLKIKKTKNQSCTNGEFTKSVYFYYDYAGTLNLQEEYKGTENQFSKKTYYFGSYEDEYKNE